MYISAVLFLFLDVKTVMFFLYIVEHYSIIKPVFLHKFKSYNKEIGKICSDEYGKACKTDHVVYHSVCNCCSSLCNYSYRNSA